MPSSIFGLIRDATRASYKTAWRFRADPVREVLGAPPGEVAAARYAARSRHPGHLPPDSATLASIKEATARIAPLDSAPHCGSTAAQLAPTESLSG